MTPSHVIAARMAADSRGLSTLWQTQRFERKFPLPEGRVEHALALLGVRAVPDPDHPCGVIHSVYFDTPGLDAYYDALNGDYRKRKIRLRWYGEPSDSEPVELFVEVKSKKGAIGEKIRVGQGVVGGDLREEVIGDTFRQIGGMSRLFELGVLRSGWIRPVIHVRYQRYRFLDLLARTPVSLDHSIRSRLVDRVLAPGSGWLQLRNAVIEVKGNTNDIPASLRPLRRDMPVWTSFSKYARCLAGHLERTGSAGHLTAL